MWAYLQHLRGTHHNPGKQAFLVLGHVLKQSDIALLLDILLRQDKYLQECSTLSSEAVIAAVCAGLCLRPDCMLQDNRWLLHTMTDHMGLI